MISYCTENRSQPCRCQHFNSLTFMLLRALVNILYTTSAVHYFPSGFVLNAVHNPVHIFLKTFANFSCRFTAGVGI